MMDSFKRMASTPFMLLLIGLLFLVVGCAKEQEVPPSQDPLEAQGNLKAGQYALFQVTNYIGNPSAPRKFDVRKDLSACLYGRVQLPGGISGAPVFGFLQSANYVYVHGYCDIHATECLFEKGASPSTLGPVYSVTPIPTGPGVPTLNIQCYGLTVPMGINGSYFSYNAATKTWSASGDASLYFAYSINHRKYYACP